MGITPSYENYPLRLPRLCGPLYFAPADDVSATAASVVSSRNVKVSCR